MKIWVESIQNFLSYFAYKQTNQQQQKHNILGGGNDIFSLIEFLEIFVFYWKTKQFILELWWKYRSPSTLDRSSRVPWKLPNLGAFPPYLSIKDSININLFLLLKNVAKLMECKGNYKGNTGWEQFFPQEMEEKATKKSTLHFWSRSFSILRHFKVAIFVFMWHESNLWPKKYYLIHIYETKYNCLALQHRHLCLLFHHSRSLSGQYYTTFYRIKFVIASLSFCLCFWNDINCVCLLSNSLHQEGGERKSNSSCYHYITCRKIQPCQPASVEEKKCYLDQWTLTLTGLVFWL